MKKTIFAAFAALMLVFGAASAADNNASVWQNIKTWTVEKKQQVQDVNWTAKKQHALDVAKKAKEKAVSAAIKVKAAAKDVVQKTKDGITDAYHQYQEKKKKKEEEVK